jgi:tRNA G46 methylase TrmB
VLRRKWRAVITVGDVETEIGVFRGEVAAAMAHDEEAKKQLGAEVRLSASRVTVRGDRLPRKGCRFEEL